MPAGEGLRPAGPAPGAAETARVFFALWPDEALRERLHETSGRLHGLHGGRRIHPDRLHLTLLFIGALPRERLAELRAAAGSVQARAFEVEFDQAECWRRNRIAFLGASAPPEALYALVEALEAAVAQAGIEFDRRPYKAHITLVRNADCRKAMPTDPRDAGTTNPIPTPIRWTAREFVLVESVIDNEGASYAVLARWPLL